MSGTLISGRLKTSANARVKTQVDMSK